MAGLPNNLNVPNVNDATPTSDKPNSLESKALNDLAVTDFNGTTDPLPGILNPGAATLNVPLANDAQQPIQGKIQTNLPAYSPPDVPDIMEFINNQLPNVDQRNISEVLTGLLSLDKASLKEEESQLVDFLINKLGEQKPQATPLESNSFEIMKQSANPNQVLNSPVLPQPEAKPEPNPEAKVLAIKLAEKYFISTEGKNEEETKAINTQNLIKLLELRHKSILTPEFLEAYNIQLERLNVSLGITQDKILVYENLTGNSLSERGLLQKTGLSSDHEHVFDNLKDSLSDEQLLIALQRIDKTISEGGITYSANKKGCSRLRGKFIEALKSRGAENIGSSKYEEALENMKSSLTEKPRLDKETIEGIKEFLTQYPEAYQEILQNFHSLNEQNTEMDSFEDFGLSLATVSQADVTTSFRPTLGDPNLNKAFDQYHLQPKGQYEDMLYRTFSTLEVAGSYINKPKWTSGLTKFLITLNNNGLFNRKDGEKLTHFVPQIIAAEKKIEGNIQQEDPIPVEIMRDYYPDWNYMPQPERNKALAETAYIRDFKSEDIELLSYHSENVRFLTYLFRGNRVGLIKDPEVRVKVINRLLETRLV